MADVRPEFVHANQFTFAIDGVIQEGVHKIEGLRQTVDVHRHVAGNQRYEYSVKACASAIARQMLVRRSRSQYTNP